MSYERHHAIIVTTFDRALAERALEQAMAIFARPIPLVASPINDYCSLFVAPDGSKEGWDISNEGDAQRAAFIAWLETQRYDDGSTPYDWVEVQYGDDMGQTTITRDSSERLRMSLASIAEQGEA